MYWNLHLCVQIPNCCSRFIYYGRVITLYILVPQLPTFLLVSNSSLFSGLFGNVRTMSARGEYICIYIRAIDIPWLPRKVSSPRHTIDPVSIGDYHGTCRILQIQSCCFHNLPLGNSKNSLRISTRTTVMKQTATKLPDSTFSCLQEWTLEISMLKFKWQEIPIIGHVWGSTCKLIRGRWVLSSTSL